MSPLGNDSQRTAPCKLTCAEASIQLGALTLSAFALQVIQSTMMQTAISKTLRVGTWSTFHLFPEDTHP